MKIDFSPYELKFINPHLAKRRGMLLRFSFSDGIHGYADCHPWPELGDYHLNEQMKLLKEGKFNTPHLKRARFFARLDAEARAESRSLFSGMAIPASHYFSRDLENFNVQEIISKGFDKIKFKIGYPFDQEIMWLKKIFHALKGMKNVVRLDFNLKLTPHTFAKFLEKIKEYLSLIDFIEDPFPFQHHLWQAFQKDYSISLACDRFSHQAIGFPESAKILILKPAIQDERPFFNCTSQEIVITSYLDHPLGQFSAAYVAAKMKRETANIISICGLMSQFAYQTHEFSEFFLCHGPYLAVPEGTGFGFDSLLEKLPWQK